MNQHLQTILDFIRQSPALNDEEKTSLSNAVAEASNEIEITAFKLDRTEKVKKTTAILLKETIEELEQKRKAVEAQNRELEIEAALERVRTVAMGMKKPGDLLNICKVLFNELRALGFGQLRNAIIHTFVDEKKYFNDYDYSDFTGGCISRIPYAGHLVIERFIKEIRKAKDAFVEITITGKELEDWKLFRIANNEAPDARLDLISSLCYYLFSIETGAIGISTFDAIEPEKLDVLKRFRNVFELAYQRYIDIEKAEAQAKEAQIEAALERVRARAMSMQTSEELNALIGTVFTELTKLDLVLTRCVIMIYEQETYGARWWMANSETPDQPMNFFVQYHELPPYLAYFNAWQERSFKWMYTLEGNIKKEWDEFIFTKTGLSELPDFVIAGMKAPDRVYLNASFNNFGNLTLASLEPLSQEHFDILLRFAKVFDLTYTRFNDLKQAEAQAKESQVQLALERVRARAMAMQRSDELAEVSSLLFRQMKSLGVNSYSSGFTIWDNHNHNLISWMCNADGSMNPPFIMPIAGDAWHIRQFESWKNGEEFLLKDITGEDMQLHFRYLRSFPLLNEAFKKSIAAGHPMPERQVHHVVNFTHGNLLFITLEPCPEAHDIFKRFGKVFEQTYTRFLDLQKAEAQTREAKIEAALERVRARAMAMHNSSDLTSTASLVFTELRNLGINPIRCGVGLLTKDSRKAQLYSATSSAGGDSLSLIGWVILSGHPVLEKIYETWLTNEDYFPELNGEQLRSYYELLLAGLPVSIPDWQSGQIQYGHFFSFPVGCLFAWSEVPYNDDEIKILKRFASVIDLTFRRYMELQKAEASAREAVKQAALNRVRAEIASMRTTADLERITPLLWSELRILGVPFIRCGVFIMDEEHQEVQTHLSTPDGKAIAAFRLSYSAPGETVAIIEHWHRKQMYKQHWNEEQFIAFTTNLVHEGAIATGEKYLTENRPTDLYLHFLPFLQGMLYAGNTAPLSDDALQLMQDLADAFSTAYSRYQDFNRLEAAKKQVDTTLSELKATQTQLVQAEKMASLGELTAGIAHEIQNPLNFVNNFAAVNKELVVEMKEEMAKGNYEAAKTIAGDIDENEQKILHHGQRADSIVRNMLQHSRASTGKKEHTDINTLVNEYLRLSYYGMRAKESSFNALVETHFDEGVGKIHVVPQEISRVLLNLFNNAFYAVNEKKKWLNGLYEPAVSVCTKKNGDYIVITVRDNGTGMPPKVAEKVFQPFFTTKPTGEGTGLGLSLSYDIVTKGHQGRIQVKTTEGEGTEFLVQLPCSDKKIDTVL